MERLSRTNSIRSRNCLVSPHTQNSSPPCLCNCCQLLPADSSECTCLISPVPSCPLLSADTSLVPSQVKVQTLAHLSCQLTRNRGTERQHGVFVTRSSVLYLVCWPRKQLLKDDPLFLPVKKYAEESVHKLTGSSGRTLQVKTIVWETFSQQPLTIWIDDRWMFLMKDYIVLKEEKKKRTVEHSVSKIKSLELPQGHSLR